MVAEDEALCKHPAGTKFNNSCYYFVCTMRHLRESARRQNIRSILDIDIADSLWCMREECVKSVPSLCVLQPCLNGKAIGRSQIRRGCDGDEYLSS